MKVDSSREHSTVCPPTRSPYLFFPQVTQHGCRYCGWKGSARRESALQTVAPFGAYFCQTTISVICLACASFLENSALLPLMINARTTLLPLVTWKYRAHSARERKATQDDDYRRLWFRNLRDSLIPDGSTCRVCSAAMKACCCIRMTAPDFK